MRRTHNACERGVTLVELLIAITLVAALAVGMLMAIRSGLTAMDRINVRLEANRRIVGLQHIVNSQISGAMPIRGDCRLLGSADALQFVTSYSINEGARGAPHLVTFTVAPDPLGGLRLFETESPYTGVCGAGEPLPPGFQPPATQTLVLASRLLSCTLLYRAPQRPDGTFVTAWTPTWNLPVLPGAIRIETVPMDAATSALPALAVNAAIHISKLQMDYIDDYQ